MKILLIIHGYPPLYNAGSEVYTQSIARELSQLHEVVVFTREENPYRPDFSVQKEHDQSTTVYRINKRIDKDRFQHAEVDQALASIVNDFQPDIAHIGHLNHLSTGLVAVLKSRSIPVVFTLHDFWLMCPRGQFLQRNFGDSAFYQLCSNQADVKCAQKCYNAYYTGKPERHAKDLSYWTSWVTSRMQATGALAARVDLFIAPSHYLRSRFIKEWHLPENKIVYEDYGFPLHYLKPPKRRPDVFTLGYIGTHIPAKGVDLLIRAFTRIKGHARLKIWGRPQGQSTAALSRMAEEAGNPVEFCGEYKNEAIVEQVFQKVHAIVVPSIWGENSPLVIHEAQATHTPVITANFGGMAEYVRHKVNGLLFAHRSVDSLAETLQYAYTHQQDLARLGKRGYLYHPKGTVPDITGHCKRLISFYKETTRSNANKQVMAHHTGYKS